MSACLAVLYRARIEYLRTSAHESASGRAQASCQKLAQRYRALADVHPGRSPLEVLVEDSGSGVTLVKPLAVMQNPETDLAAWARKQVPPFDVPPALTKDLISTSAWELSRLPYTDFYSISSNQGTAHCYDTHYFEVRDGRATEAGMPPGFDEQGGASCMVSRSFGRIDGASVYFQEAYDFTPSMSSTLTVATWDGASFAGACTVTFSFAPAFGDRTLNAWEEACKGEGCQELRRAAFQLAAAVQRDPRRARDQLRSALTPAQQNAYDEALKDVAAENPEEAAANSDDLDPAYITKESPLRLPYVHQGRLYLASVGHFTIGWRHFADWSVEFQSIENGRLVPRASFAVGMAKGRLEGVSVASP